ncbi:hypothetical protein Bca4012_035287 [Brassica carinata]
MEDQNPDTMKRLNEAVRLKKELEQKEYSDLSISDAERIGLFKEKKYHDAVRHYPEVIKRNPKGLRSRPFLIILCASVHIRQPSCVLQKTDKFFQGRHIGNKRDVNIAIKTILDVDLIEVKGDRSKTVLFNAGRVAKGLGHLDEKYDKEKWEILSSVVGTSLLCSVHCDSTRTWSNLVHESRGTTHFGLTDQFQSIKGDVRVQLIIRK